MEISYPYLSEKQINSIRQYLIPAFNKEKIFNFQELEDAQAEGLEWLELFEDNVNPYNLSHLTNKQLGLIDNADQDVRDEFFDNEFSVGGEWIMVEKLIWEWLEENDWRTLL